MEPVVSHGDMAMIDRGRTTIHDGGVYAIGIHDALYIKRLIMQPNGRVCVVSENEKRYPTFESDYESLRILGQIIWIARQLI
jgi:phage repressor protein C with HTH and peptisase S24 domain